MAGIESIFGEKILSRRVLCYNYLGESVVESTFDICMIWYDLPILFILVSTTIALRFKRCATHYIIWKN